MKRLLPIALFATICFYLVGCTDEGTARRVLAQNGYTDVQTTGYAAFMCSDSDDFSTGFTAKSPKGVQVEGAVCSAFGKGNTIRFK